MPGTFSGFDLNVTNLNGHPMSSLITLHTEQSFTETLNVDEVHTNEPIEVGGLVNGLNLDIERSNTLFVDGNQTITGKIIFESVEVLGDLQVNDKVNGKDFHNLAYLQNDLYFNSPLQFQSVQARHVEVRDTISGIKFEYWHDQSLWHNGKDLQIISGNWEIENLLIKDEAVGNGLVNNVHIQKIIDEIYKNRTEMVSNLQEHLQETKEICYDVMRSAEQSRDQIYFLKYFENSFTMSSNDGGIISAKHFFKHLNNVFLVISSGCLSEFFIWNTEKYFFVKLFQLETGFVDDWISLPELDSTYLVSNSNNYSYNCRISGSNIWKLSGKSLEHISKISNSEEFKSLHRIDDRDNYFYILQNTTFPKITEFDISGSSTEEWILPPGRGYRFVPDEANIGLAVSDGRKLSILNSNVNKSRIKRTFLGRHNGTALKMKLEEIRRKIRSRLERGPLLTILRMNQDENEKTPIIIRPFQWLSKNGSSEVRSNGRMELPIQVGSDNVSLLEKLLNLAHDLLERSVKDLKRNDNKTDFDNPRFLQVGLSRKVQHFNERMNKFNSSLSDESKSAEEVGLHAKRRFYKIKKILRKSVPKLLHHVFKITSRLAYFAEILVGSKKNQTYEGIINEFIKNGTDLPAKMTSLTTKMEGAKRSLEENESNDTQTIEVPVESVILSKLESGNGTMASEDTILKLTGQVNQITNLLEGSSNKTVGFENLLDSAIHLLDQTENKNISRTTIISLPDKINEFNSRMEKLSFNESSENVGTSLKESLSNVEDVFKTAVPRVLDQVFKITARLERFKEKLQGKEDVGSIQRFVLDNSNEDEIVSLTNQINEIRTKEVPFKEVSHFEEFLSLALDILEQAEKNNGLSVNASRTSKQPMRKNISSFNSRMKDYQKKVPISESPDEVGISIKESLSNVEDLFKNIVPRVLDQVFKITARMERFKENFQAKDQNEYVGSVYKNDTKIKEEITRLSSQMKEINKLIGSNGSSINHSHLERLLTSALTLLEHTEKNYVTGNISRTSLNDKIVEFNTRMRQLNSSETVGINIKDSLTDLQDLFQKTAPKILDEIFKITVRLEKFKENFKGSDSEYVGVSQNDPMVGDPIFDRLTEVAVDVAIKLALKLGDEIEARLAKGDLLKPISETVGSSINSTKSSISNLSSHLDRINWNIQKHKSSRASLNVTELNTTETYYTTTDYAGIENTELPELQIAKELPVGGVLSADNSFLPEHGRGEIVVLKVGSKWNRRTLIAVSSQKETVIVGNHDVIHVSDSCCPF